MRWLILVWLAAVAPAQERPAPSDPEPPLSSEQIELEHLKQLLGIRRVYVDRLNGGDNVGPLRDMVIAALQKSRLFIVTEDEARADAYLRGSAEDLVFTEVRASREGLNVRAGGRVSDRERSGTDSASAAFGAGETEDHYLRQRKHEAVAALRLVAKDGDVLWSTTQESLGAKFKGSSADVAEKITKELAAAYARARKLVSSQPSAISRQP